MCKKCESGKKEKFYITTAIPYASQKPHFGNTYEVIMTDAVARYKRQRGYDVFFLTGTDEHGQKIEEKAAEAGITPKEYADGVVGEIKGVWNKMNTTYDKFIRTTDDYHERAVRHIFQKLYDKGDIYKSEYEGWYCTPDESFFTDSQVVDGKCPECGRPVERAKEEAYFFKMKKYAPRLIEYMNEHPDFILPELRKKEMLNNFLLSEDGLQDLCVTRSSFKWGIPVPFDSKHVIYVWIDALSNYITALGYDPENETQPELFNKNWPCDCHVIGKDIMRFHSIYWPILLMALDLPLPKTIFGHPWFNRGQDKMSKSRQNVIYADDLARFFGVDGVRYYALAEMPYASDGSITYDSVIARYNNDLANILGNLVKRTVDMCRKYFAGKVPTPHGDEGSDSELKGLCEKTVSSFKEKMDSYRIADAISDVMALLRRANKYIDETTPWVLAKEASCRERLESVIYNLLEVIRTGAVLLCPIIPDACEKIFSQLGTDKVSYETVENGFGALEAGNEVGESFVIFSRVDEKKILDELDGDAKAARSNENAKTDNKEKEVREVKEAKEEKGDADEKGVTAEHEIGIETFSSVELRCAEVLECEKVKKSKKLLKLKLNLGYEVREVVSGIAEFYEPSSLVGKKVVVVANLKPAVLCGVESRGMILASGEKDVRVVFLSDDVAPGERIR